jgi:membrane-associated HD superfamily phosphohydrolase
MSLRALPLMVIPFILYNIVVVFAGSGPATGPLSAKIFALPMLRGATWTFTWGDLILLITLIVLFAELVKATYTSSVSLVDHGLSMLVFVACIVEFLVVNQAATSVFFLVMIASLIDVVAGFTIGIRVARRDLSIGGAD